MAIVKFQSAKIVALSTEKEKILDLLRKTGAVELKEVEEIENTHTRLNTARVNDVSLKLSKLNTAITFLEEQNLEAIKLNKKGVISYTPPKKPLFAVRDDISFDDFLASTVNEVEMFAHMEDISKIADDMVAERTKILSLRNNINMLTSFSEIDAPLDDVKNSQNVCFFIGQVPDSQTDGLEKINEIALAGFSKIQKVGPLCSVFAYCHKSCEEELSSVLTEVGFVKSNIECDVLPCDKIKSCLDEISVHENCLNDLTVKATKFYYIIKELKKLYDYYAFKLQKINAEGDFRRSTFEKVVCFEAWVLEDKIDFVKQTILDFTDKVYFQFDEAREDQIPPTLTNNGKVVGAFESVTNMYSAPSYRENDPTFSVMIFFFLFFGFMLSDAGYGILLASACFIILKLFPLEKGMRSLVIILALGGVSTIIWGVLLGGWFSIDIEGTIFEKIMWFAPLENPIAALGLSLGIGVLQILYGMGMRAVELIKRKQVVDAICDIGSWYVLFLGIGLFAVSLLPGFEAMKDIGMYVALVGVAMLILTQGRNEKNVFMKLFKGVGSLYGIMNYVSDILSYARLFGLGLATGVVGMVFNTIGGVFFEMCSGIPFVGSVIGVIIAGVFILAGHTLNIGINVLGAYVHDCRLQFIEFFSKFYEGNGRVFVALGADSKYTNVH